MRFTVLSVLVFCLIPTILFSQSQTWEGGLAIGGLNYTGDLVKSTFPNVQETNTWISIYAGRQLRENLALQAHLGTGTISGDDRNYEDRKLRSFYFQTQIVELQVRLQWYPFQPPGQTEKRFNPYGFGGIGLFYLSPDATLNRAKLPNLREAIEFDQNNLPSRLQPALPFGVGLDFQLNRRIKLGLEADLRLTSTDYLDGVSQAGNPEGNDWYGSLSLKVGYHFGKSDLDGDGIVDQKDGCPEWPGPIELGGCPDSEGDGITDLSDLCPNLKGDGSVSGCPDRDGDGVPDPDDRCPDIAGQFQTGGCPLNDRDNDGIPDQEDPCPLQFGPPERQGCPLIDSDEDGLLDEDDHCPDQYGLAIFQGCPDTDGDGIQDREDKCPTLFGLYSQQGCPLQISAEDQAKTLNRQVLIFPSGSTSIERYSLLDQILAFMEQYPDYQLSIKGFTDKEGNDINNLQLSSKRAKVCYDYFRGKGIAPDRMTFQGYGSDYPISENLTERGRQQNRRVEFQLFK